MKSYQEIINSKFPYEIELIHEFTYERNLEFTNLDSYIRAIKDVLYIRPSPWLEYKPELQLKSFLDWLIQYSKENDFSIDLNHAKFTNSNN